MTDKVQKIREGIERLKSQLIKGACASQIAMETHCKEEAYNEVLAILDSLQEEPKKCMFTKDGYTDEDRKVLCDGCEEECKYAQKEEPVSEDKMTIRKDWFEQCKKSWYNEGYIDGKHNRDGQFGEPVSDECIYNRTLEERQRSCKFCSAACQVRIKEEPVSEELEEASKEWLAPQLDKSYANYGEAKMMELTHFDGYAMLDAIEFGAKWQKSKMVRNAMGGEVKFSDAECRGYRGDFWIESRFLTPYEANEYVGGEKVKLIIIKED